MGKKKPMSKEERLKKKRECEKRRRDGIKLSAEATEALKIQKHDIYLRLKSQGKVKMINQMNRREKKERRKRWNINTQNRPSIKCNHYHLVEKNVLSKENVHTLEDPLKKDQENLQVTKSVTRLKYEDVYGSDDSLESGKGGSRLKIGGWVVVNYEGTNYPGEIAGKDNEGVEVKVMHPSAGRKYKWPSK